MTRQPHQPRFDESRSAAIYDLLVAQADKSRRPRAAKRLAWLAVSALAATAVLTGGAILVLEAPVTDTQTVACFARAEISAGTFPGTYASVGEGMLAESTPVDDGDGSIMIDDAVAVCSDLWAQRVLDSELPSGTSSEPSDRSFSGPVPEQFVVCVLRDGVAAVVPGPSNTCRALGLAEKTQ